VEFHWPDGRVTTSDFDSPERMEPGSRFRDHNSDILWVVERFADPIEDLFLGKLVCVPDPAEPGNFWVHNVD
jgi:hypothetical protein